MRKRSSRDAQCHLIQCKYIKIGLGPPKVCANTFFVLLKSTTSLIQTTLTFRNVQSRICSFTLNYLLQPNDGNWW